MTYYKSIDISNLLQIENYVFNENEIMPQCYICKKSFIAYTSQTKIFNCHWNKIKQVICKKCYDILYFTFTNIIENLKKEDDNEINLTIHNLGYIDIAPEIESNSDEEPLLDFIDLRNKIYEYETELIDCNLKPIHNLPETPILLNNQNIKEKLKKALKKIKIINHIYKNIKNNKNRLVKNKIIYPKISLNIIKNLNIKESDKRHLSTIKTFYNKDIFLKKCYNKYKKYIEYLINKGKPIWDNNMLSVHEQIKNNIHKIPDNNQHLINFNNNFDNIAKYANEFTYYIENSHLIKLSEKLKNYKVKTFNNDIIKSIYNAKYNKLYEMVKLGKYLISNDIKYSEDIIDEEIYEYLLSLDTKISRGINYIKKIYYLNKHIDIKCLVDLKLKQVFRELSINDFNKLLLMLE